MTESIGPMGSAAPRGPLYRLPLVGPGLPVSRCRWWVRWFGWLLSSETCSKRRGPSECVCSGIAKSLARMCRYRW